MGSGGNPELRRGPFSAQREQSSKRNRFATAHVAWQLHQLGAVAARLLLTLGLGPSAGGVHPRSSCQALGASGGSGILLHCCVAPVAKNGDDVPGNVGSSGDRTYPAEKGRVARPPKARKRKKKLWWS